MKKYRAKVVLSQVHYITIEADSWQEAQDIADEMDINELELDEPDSQEVEYIDVEGEVD